MSQSPFEYLAQRFPQLYVAPGPYAEEPYKLAFSRGAVPEHASLDHFRTTVQDWLRVCKTPAGEVEVLFLADREDFETFIRCTTRRARLDPIPISVGAMTIGGLPDWSVLRAKRDELVAELGEGWLDAYKEFISEPSGYKITLVVISEGPNSAVPASELGMSDEEWLERSREIRVYHELAHVVARRLMPESVLPVWDEVTADFHGILHAFGAYDATLALRLLGIVDGAYIGGRLQEYLNEEQMERMDEIAMELSAVCRRLELAQGRSSVEQSYDTLMELKRSPYIAY